MHLLIKIITFPFSIVYWVVFFLILIVFHGFQWVAFNLFGYQAHKKVVDVMNFFLVKTFWLAGVRYNKTGVDVVKTDQPTIIVSNHQSMFDIPPMIWYLRALHPKFIAKAELSKGVPGISYNLRHGGSVLIDRENRVSAMDSINLMGEYIEKHNRAVVIFPEGTRSKTGEPLNWKMGGLIALIEQVPNARILPVTITGSWKILKNKGWPIPFGTKIEMKVHESMYFNGEDIKTFIGQIKSVVERPLITLIL